MDKNKIILTYLDFINGKFMAVSERLSFIDTEKKAKKLINDFLNIQIKNDFLSSDLHSLLSEYIIKNDHKLDKKDLNNIVKFATQNNYYKIFSEKKFSVESENIYCISDKIYDYFLNIPLPESFYDLDYLFMKDLPALFIFENGEVGYLTYISNFENKTELNLMIFGDNRSIKCSVNFIIFERDFLFNSFNEEYYKNNMSKEALEYEKPYIQKFQNIIHFFCNLLLFLKVKDTIDLVSEELNPIRIQAQKNIDNKKNIGRNNQILNNTKSYKFVDLDLTLSEYSRKYKERNPESYTSSKAPHWRTGHFHSFWVGKRDGSQEKKRVIKFIPTIWIGNPDQMQEQTIFKVIK